MILVLLLLAQDSVIVTGTYSPIPLDESNRSVASIPLERARRILYGDLTELLRTDASVDLQARGPGNIQTDIVLRGGTFGQTLVLWNGLRLNDAQSGHHNLDTPIPLASLDRVEILKGAGSTVYGSDAVGGVVNFVTLPAESTQASLRTGIGNFGSNEQHLDVSILLPRGWSQQVSAARDFTTGFQPDRDARNLSIAAAIHHQGTDLQLAISDRPFGADQFYGNYPSWERTKSWFAGLRQMVGANTEIDFGYRRHTDLFVLFRDRPEIYTNRHALDTTELALRRKSRLAANTTLHYGASGLYESIDSNNLGVHTRARAAAYAAVDFRALRRYSLNIGAREEVYEGLAHQFSPSITAGIWISPKWRLRGGSNHAFRLPSFTDLYYHDPANQGSPNLQPERSWSHEGAIEWRPSTHVLAQATVFTRLESGVIDYVRATPTDIWRATNFHHVHATGVEASVQAKEVTVSYAALQLSASNPIDLNSKYQANYPVHNASVRYAKAMPYLLFTTHVSAIARIGRPAYALWDVSAARRTGNIRPYVRLTNITSTEYQEIAGVNMPKRGVIGGLEFRLSR